MGARTINEIIKSPFFASEIIFSFLEGYHKEIDYQLIYFILPIIYNGNCREKLNTANKKSSIYTLFSSSKKYFNLVNLNSKIDLYNIYNSKNNFLLTANKALIILSTKGKINFNSRKIKLVDSDESFKLCKDKQVKSYLKSAYYFGVILSKSNIIEFLELVKGA